jgi:molybdenum cofactor synthesis domain-containing protein
MRVAVVTISDSVFRGSREDRSGQALCARCRELGWEVSASVLVSDDADLVTAQLIRLADSGEVDLVLTTGGTGLGPRDVTPEATARAAEKLVPGLGERMREAGCRSNARAALSRSQGACRGQTLILNLPGSPRGAVESLDAVADIVPHAVEILHGAGHDSGAAAPGA